MLTPEDYSDLLLEQTEGPTPNIKIERKSQNIRSEEETSKTSKESSSSPISEDVHKVSMEVVSTIRAGIIND